MTRDAHQHVWAQTVNMFYSGRMMCLCTCFCGAQELRPITHNGWVL